MTKTIGTNRRILGTMRRASFFILAFSSSCLAILGDWKVWSPSYDARMAAIVNNTAWVATSGGMMEWDLSTGGTSRMHTRLNGLPTNDFASVVVDSQKTLWAIGTDGRIAYRALNSTEWQLAESYSGQNWLFAKRAALVWKNFLIFGTDHGVSLYSIKSKTAEDLAHNFDTLTGKVRAIMVTPAIPIAEKPSLDTLWVAFEHGLAYATPNWDSIGVSGHYLIDPTQWKIKTTLANKDTNLVLIHDANGVRLGNSLSEWSNASGDLYIQSSQVHWAQTAIPVSGAVHATEFGSGLIVSTSLRGAIAIDESGSLRTTSPEGNYPDILPYNVRINSQGVPYALSNNHLLNFASAQWNTETIHTPDASGSKDAVWAFSETLSRIRQGLSINPLGEIVVPTWSSNLYPGLYKRSENQDWLQYKLSASNSCLGITQVDHPELGPALMGAHAFNEGTWMSFYKVYSSQSRVIFLPSGPSLDATCLDLPTENILSGDYINDFLPIGDTLWMASPKSLVRLPSPRPTNPPTLAPQSTFLKPGSQEIELFRLAQVQFEGKTWIVGAGNGRLALYPSDSKIGGRTYPNLIISDNSAPTLNQSYRAISVDAQNHIWAAGEQGIDIVRLVSSDSDTLPPSFEAIQRVTTAQGLPENFIYDFDLQASTGKAIIATPSAVALWTSPYRPIPPKLVQSKIRVYPNPIRLRDRPGQEGNKSLFVDGATSDSQLDLFAADGTLVLHFASTTQIGGIFQVELPPPAKIRPGLYFWSLKDKNTSAHGPLLIAE